MSEHTTPASPPPGFQPFKRKEEKRWSKPLMEAFDRYNTELGVAMAKAVDTGDSTEVYALMRRAFVTVVDFGKRALDDQRSDDPMVKAFHELVDIWEARQKENTKKGLDQSLDYARKLLDFAREAVRGTGEVSAPEGAVSADALTEEATFKLLELAGFTGEQQDPTLAAIEKYAPFAVKIFNPGSPAAPSRAAHAHHHHHGVPDGAAVEAMAIDPTIVMQVLSFLVAQGHISEDGEIEENLWGAVQRAAAAQATVRDV